MKSTYILFLPLFFYVVSKKVKEIKRSIEAKNTSKLKADLFFFALVIIISVGIVFSIEMG
jgi:TRAP-type mannitol/chloroaromatic compound transport system permease small subunit